MFQNVNKKKKSHKQLNYLVKYIDKMEKPNQTLEFISSDGCGSFFSNAHSLQFILYTGATLIQTNNEYRKQ